MQFCIDGHKAKLSIVEFNKEAKVFSLWDDEKETSILFHYLPNLDTGFEGKNYKIFFLTNPYLNAEVDHFPIVMKSKVTGEKLTIGWVFPIRALNSNDVSHNLLDKIKYRVFFKLLENKQGDFSYRGNLEEKTEYQITDIYDENIIILVIDMGQWDDPGDFLLLEFLPSLAGYGYNMWVRDEKRAAHTEIQEVVSDKIKGKTNIVIKNCCLQISQYPYLSTLYNEHLPTIHHSFMRFHFLYQVIESMLEIQRKHMFEECIGQYHRDEISANELREKLQNVLKERAVIKKLFSTAGKLPDNDFELAVRDFFGVAGFSYEEKCTADLIYNVRNKVVHNYGAISHVEDALKLLEKITNYFELIIHHLVTHYNPNAPT